MLRVVNGNLQKNMETSTSRDRENVALTNEVKTLREMLESIKQDSKEQKDNHKVTTTNLRMQLEETRDLVSNVKEVKEKEFRKLREKCDEDIRRETDKYQFEYDKLREEI
jgi:hypothetical protein